MKIVADAHIPYIKEYFGVYGELFLKAGRSICHADVKDADMLLVRSITHVDQALLANTRVKFVGSATAGADHLDTQWLDSAEILWDVATGFNAPPVADYVVSTIAALQRKGLLCGKGLTAAVIGVGNVGALVAERLQWLGFNVQLCDPIRAEQESEFTSIAMEKIADVDLISLHVPLTKTGAYATRHFIDKAFLQRQKPGCVLLNASRGSVIHTHELLEHGKHLHWCFDVWEHEPNINHHVLEQAVIATPHIAGYSVQSKIRGTEMLYQMACAKKMLVPQALKPIPTPQQPLTFASTRYHWQDIVLGVFNPLIITAMMRAILITPKDHGALFDDMRHQFNYRNEFAFTEISGAILTGKDKDIIQQLGLR